MKNTFFGCSLEGDSTFEGINRVIQTYELFIAGGEGDSYTLTGQPSLLPRFSDTDKNERKIVQ